MIRLLIALGACATTPALPLPVPVDPPAPRNEPLPEPPVAPRVATAVAVGFAHSCALLDDGHVACWGSDRKGQLGDGFSGESRHVAAEAGIDDAVRIAAAGDHSCAVRTDGELFCWGASFGASPRPVMAGVVDVALGDGLCALGVAGEVRCGTFGPDGVTDLAVVDDALDGVVEIAAGIHGCARRVDGTIRCWGDGRFGERGDGRYLVARGATEVRGLDDAVDLAAGRRHACAARSDGTVVCWGQDRYGQLGDGQSGRGPVRGTKASSAPVRVEGLTGVVQVAAGGDVTCARTADALHCWGRNAYGQAGVSLDAASQVRGAVVPHQPRPAPVPSLSGLSDVAVGPDHACAVVAGGRVSCWGLNLDGQLGAEPITHRTRPVRVDGLRAERLALGAGYSCASTSEGEVRCWGGFAPGFDPDLANNGSFVPVSGRPRPVAGISGATELALGFSHGCARLGDGTMRCWGRNEAAQIVPRRWSALSFRSVRLPLRDVDEIAAGGFHTCATDRHGKVRCWGGIHGAVTGNRLTRRPTVVAGLGEATQVAAGRRHTCVLEKSGRIACWGDNFYGAIGRTDSDASETPNEIEGLPPISALAVGEHHSCALTTAGDVYCWGAFQRRLVAGRLRAVPAPDPVRIGGLRDAVGIACGAAHTCARLGDGRVACFGDNRFGQLGDGSTDYRAAPVLVESVTNAVEVAAGDTHGCARTGAGEVLCWGDNRRAELGDGTVPYTHVPVVAAL